VSAALIDNSTHLPAPQHFCLGVVEGWADCWVVKMSTSDLGAVINFFLVGDAKYSVKIEMIGAALIDEGIWCGRAKQST